MGLSPDALFEAICSDLPDGTDSFESVPPPGTTYKRYVSAYLKYSLIRKWIPEKTQEADMAALDSFTSANTRCSSWKIPDEEWEIDRVIYGEIRRHISDLLHPNGMPLIGHLYDLNEVARPGPGAARGALGTSYYTKFFCSKLSSTSEYLYEMYRHYAARLPSLSDAECQRYESYGGLHLVSGSRSSFVPKTNRTSRMICVEPTLNSYYQLGLATLLEERLRESFGINLSTQPSVNHQLARLGSIDGSYSTIDLSSASDSISLGLCEWLLPDWFFELLLQLRSRTTLVNGKEVALFMVSTMGNGFTFPLQTIIFSAILKACTSVFLNGSNGKAWSCYGDDLICSSKIYDRVAHYLGKLGFTINASKSFSQGPFRESCGADWLYGQPVRPVYVRKLDGPQDILVTINQLNEWSAYTGIPLWNAVGLLLQELPRRYILPVPFSENMDSGIRVPLSLCRPMTNLNGSFMYKTWSRRPSRLLILGGVVRPPGWKRKDIEINPNGLICSLLWGELVPTSKGIMTSPFSRLDADFIMVRHDRKMFQLKPRCSPFWDYIPMDSLSNGYRLSWQQWETAVVVNLYGHCAHRNSLISYRY